LNSRFFYTVVRLYGKNLTNCVKEGFTISVQCFEFQLHQEVQIGQKAHPTGCFVKLEPDYNIHFTSLTQLVPQAQVLKTTVWRVT
jgi:hypothetical protein